MKPDSAVQPRSRKTAVLVVFDTKRIRHVCSPSQDIMAPAAVQNDHLFMVGAGRQDRSGELRFEASIGDVFAVTGTSTDHNSGDAVIVYSMRLAAHGRVLHRFTQHFVTRECAAQPDPASVCRDGLPALKTAASYSSFESRIIAYGSQLVHVDFALYTLSEDGQTQQLSSYCRCGIRITVLRHPEADVE